MYKLFYTAAEDQTQIFNACKTNNGLSELWPQTHNWALHHLPALFIPVLESLHKQEWIVMDLFPRALCPANAPRSLHHFLWTETHGQYLKALGTYLYDFSNCHDKMPSKGNLRKKVCILAHSSPWWGELRGRSMEQLVTWLPL